MGLSAYEGLQWIPEAIQGNLHALFASPTREQFIDADFSRIRHTFLLKLGQNAEGDEHDDEVNQGTYICEHIFDDGQPCSRRFKNNLVLAMHKRQHGFLNMCRMAQVSNQCILCHRKYADIECAKKHLQRTYARGLSFCSSCARGSMAPVPLVVPQEMACPICSLTFSVWVHLRAHLVTHLPFPSDLELGATSAGQKRRS